MGFGQQNHFLPPSIASCVRSSKGTTMTPLEFRRKKKAKARLLAAAALALAGYVFVADYANDSSAVPLGNEENYAVGGPGAQISSRYVSSSKSSFPFPAAKTKKLDYRRYLCASSPSDAIAKNSGLGLFGNGAVFGLGRRFLSCESYNYEDTTFPPTDNPEGTPDYGAAEPGGADNVAYVVTLSACPEDSATQPSYLLDQDPGSDAFYDAAAILQHSVCNCSSANPDSGSAYNHTLYAIVHPDAVNCPVPTTGGARRLQGGNEYYNRVAMLQDLGFWVKIYEEPVKSDEIPAANAYLKANVDSVTGTRDLLKLHAYRLTTHPLAVVMSFDAMMTEPLDADFDAMLSDPDAIVSYQDDAASGGVDMSFVVLKPDAARFDAVKDKFKNTPYDDTNGWSANPYWSGSPTSSEGMGLPGFLKYYFSGENSAEVGPNPKKDFSFDLNNNDKMKKFDATCGKPWECKHDENWSVAQKDTCKAQNSKWFSYRYDFEQNWNRPTTIDLSASTYHRDNFLGYCTADASQGGYKGVVESAVVPTPVPTPQPTEKPTDAPVTAAPAASPTPPFVDPCNGVDLTSYDICLDTENLGTYPPGTPDWSQALTDGANRWESVIVGDLPGTYSLASLTADTNCGNAPTAVDDLYICARDPPIDGAYGVLGSAGPTVGFFINGRGMPVAGRIQFDSADIERMMTGGYWNEVVVHEMGHILGLGGVWRTPGWYNQLVSENAPYTYIAGADSNACREWRTITGCALGGPDECPPIEQDGGGGTAGGHWDEAAMEFELMSGWVDPNGNSKLSAITVGAMNDMGYTVDYNAADPYTNNYCPGGRRRLQEKYAFANDAEQTRARSAERRSKGVRGVRAVAVLDRDLGAYVRPAEDDPRRRRRLSSAGEDHAVAYSHQKLDEAAAEEAAVTAGLQADNPGQTVLYYASHFISTIYEEDGVVYTVDIER